MNSSSRRLMLAIVLLGWGGAILLRLALPQLEAGTSGDDPKALVAASPPAPSAASAMTEASSPQRVLADSQNRISHVPYGGLSGRLLGADDRAPLSGLVIACLEVDLAEPAPRLDDLIGSKSRPAAWHVAAQGRSDGEGRFQLAGLRCDARHRLVIGRDTGWYRSVPVHDPLLPDGVLELGELLLERGARLRGRLLDASGSPIVGAKVWVGIKSGAEPIDRGRLLLVTGEPDQVVPLAAGEGYELENGRAEVTRSDGDGRFALTASPAGLQEIRVRAPGFASYRQQLELRAGEIRDLGDLQLDTLPKVRGRVVDDQGHGVAGAWVAIAGGDGARAGAVVGHILSEPQRTSNDGSFCLRASVQGQVCFAFRREGAPFWQVSGPVASTDEVDLTLPPAASGVLALQTGGLNLPESIRVGIAQVAEGGSAGLLESPLRFAWNYRHPERGRSVAFGPRYVAADRYLRAVPGERGVWRIDGLPAGTYRLLIRAAGFAPACGWIRLAPGEPSRLALLLHAEQERTFALCDDVGVPVAGARLYCISRGQTVGQGADKGTAMGESTPSLAPMLVGVSDADGAITCRGLPIGAWSFFATHPHLATGYSARQVSGPGPMKVVLPRLGAIAGRIDPPTGSFTVVATRRASAVTQPDIDRHGRRVQLSADNEGRFRFDDLSPGVWCLSVVPAGQEGAPVTQAGVVQRCVAVDSAKVTTLTLTTPTRANPAGSATVCGVLWVDGRPVEGMQVQVAALERRQGTATTSPMRRLAAVRTSAEGTFELRGLVPGWCRITVSRGMAGIPPKLWVLRADIAAGEVRRVVIDLRLGTVRLRVVNSRGAPVPGLQLSLRGIGGGDSPSSPTNGISRRGICDDNGNIMFADMPLGSYRLSGSSSEHVLAAVELHLTGNAATDRCVLHASRRVR